jgi:hypothetical protein
MLVRAPKTENLFSQRFRRSEVGEEPCAAAPFAINAHRREGNGPFWVRTLAIEMPRSLEGFSLVDLRDMPG